MIGRIPVLDVSPSVDAGRWPARAVVGEAVPVRATVFREGHDAVAATVVVTDPAGKEHSRSRMTLLEPGLDRWGADVVVDQEGCWTFRVEGWSDPYGTWEHDAVLKVAADVDTELMLTEGALLLERAAGTPGRGAEEAAVLRDAVTGLRDAGRPPQARLAAGTSAAVHAALAADPVREMVSPSEEHAILVQRELALYGSWYEFFPRSEGARYDAATDTWISGTLRTAAERLDAIAAMGFDVAYLTPIHPIGSSNRKGRNNTLDPRPGDPGSPYAIGSEDGGHDAIEPSLGTFEDFDAFVARARELGLEVALDLALQCSPDHPWVKTHPEWFTTRADGTIAYAENPPKKYQDIYPVNFDNDPDGIYAEVLRVVLLWVEHGVTLFRVDNPHTKPVQFWEWLLGQVRKTDPDVIFLSEAFTKPVMMRGLGTVGFHQSYTYFTWRNAKWELEEYLNELAHVTAPVLRPNFFVNTPDILHAYLQYGGPAAFKIRAAIAATGSPSWGVYAGFELFEHVAVKPGSEEYLDSEKFQIRIRDWDTAEAEGRTLSPYITRLNQIRRQHPALQQLRNLTIHSSEDDSILVFSKSAPAHDGAADGAEDTVIVVVNVDPHSTRETTVHINMPALGMEWFDQFSVHDEVTGETWTWGERNYVRLDPYYEPAHILTVRRPHP
ncbi:MAG: alpha-1,4-glucan--maltose-1-phosphate maltosyltransferase [Ornithinibacter sp.]